MAFKDLREFLAQLEDKGQLVRIKQEISAELEMTEICDRTLRAGGPALLFENVSGHDMPVLGNLFGTTERVAMAMGQESVEALREVGELLAFLKEPEPPAGVKDAWSKLPIFKQVLNMAPKEVKKGPCQQIVLQGDEVNLNNIPIQTCWPGDAAPLVTWPLVITKGPNKKRQNLGIYRMQKNCTQQTHYALAQPPWRRLRFSRIPKTKPGRTLPRKHCLRCRPRHHPWRRHPSARHPKRIRLCWFIARL